jgi:predicted nuclease with TOPRIM domain
MSCKICGRNSCTESFHSMREQSENEPDFLRERIESLEFENARLKEGLRKLEWSAQTFNSFTCSVDCYCPECEAPAALGHNEDCWLAELLK